MNILLYIKINETKRKINNKRLLSNTSLLIPFTNQKGYPMNSIHSGFTSIITSPYDTVIRLSPKIEKNNNKEYTGGITQITPIKAKQFEIKLNIKGTKKKESNINILLHNNNSPIMKYLKETEGLKKYRNDYILNSFNGYRIELILNTNNMLEVNLYKHLIIKNEINEEKIKKIKLLKKGEELKSLLEKENDSIDSNGDLINEEKKDILEIKIEKLFNNKIEKNFLNSFDFSIFYNEKLEFFINKIKVGELKNILLENNLITICSKGGDFLLNSMLVFDLNELNSFFNQKEEQKSNFLLFLICGILVILAILFFIFFK